MAHQENTRVAHINGYNLVPKEHLTLPGNASRLSIYPESYAWATWDRAWQKYDDDLTWARNASLKDIKKICGSTVGALRWKQNFSDAAAERIDTWAYRWLASMWQQNWLMVSPNRNIATYQGLQDGTHTRREVKCVEPRMEKLSMDFSHIEKDDQADKYIGKVIMGEKLVKLVIGIPVSATLNLIKIREQSFASDNNCNYE